MKDRQSLPRIWLVTDERMGERLLGAVDRLPRQAGILFRHYSLEAAERRRLFDAVLQRGQALGATLLLAGPPALAAQWGADGWHGWDEGIGLHSVSVHNLTELRRAQRSGAALLFVSPVFATRSHPEGRVLGLGRFAALARRAGRPVIALGGVMPADAPKLQLLGAYGWAGVDAWLD